MAWTKASSTSLHVLGRARTAASYILKSEAHDGLLATTWLVVRGLLVGLGMSSAWHFWSRLEARIRAGALELRDPPASVGLYRQRVFLALGA
jgi:hypothetical protein